MFNVTIDDKKASIWEQLDVASINEKKKSI